MSRKFFGRGSNLIIRYTGLVVRKIFKSFASNQAAGKFINLPTKRKNQ